MKTVQDQMTTEDSLIDTIIRERVALAPMSGVTDIPFRLMARKFGCPFAFTEMVDINGIFYRNKKSFTLLDMVPGDSPIGVQLVGDDPERFLHVAKICEDKGYKLIDINAGCPARKVVKSCKGSALMKEPEKLAEIVRKLVKNLSVPVTVKIRSGWNEDNRNYLEVAKIAVSEGAKAICIHPRTREQMYKGKPDRDIILHLKESVNVPVFASGGIFKASDAQDAVSQTRCDAVFVARGALGRPWIFREIKDVFGGREVQPEPDFAELKEIIKEHFALSLRFYNDFRTQKRMYKYISWYFMRYKNTGEIMKIYLKIKDIGDLDGFLAKIEVDERKHLYFA